MEIFPHMSEEVFPFAELLQRILGHAVIRRALLAWKILAGPAGHTKTGLCSREQVQPRKSLQIVEDDGFILWEKF